MLTRNLRIHFTLHKMQSFHLDISLQAKLTFSKALKISATNLPAPFSVADFPPPRPTSSLYQFLRIADEEEQPDIEIAVPQEDGGEILVPHFKPRCPCFSFYL